MELILLFGMFVLGLGAGSFAVLPVLIVLRFGIPHALKLRSLGVLKDNKPLLNYSGSLVILPLVLLGIAYAIRTWAPSAETVFWIGVACPVLFGLGSTGPNPANLQDFYESNAESIDQEKLAASQSRTSPHGSPDSTANLEELVQEYGGVLQRVSKPGVVAVDESLLPANRDTLKRAILFALGVTTDSTMRDQLKIGYFTLSMFQANVGPDPVLMPMPDLPDESDHEAVAELARSIQGQLEVAQSWSEVVARDRDSLVQELAAAGL